MTITTQDQLINALANNSQQFIINKASLASQVAGLFTSLWRSTGVPTQGAIPTTAAIIDRTTTGVFLFNNPTAPARSYLGRLFGIASVSGTDVQMHDRLGHMGGLSGIVTTAQTVNLDITGYGSNLNNRIGESNFSDVQWFLEWYVATGATVATATVTYTNSSGVSGRTTTVALTASIAASRMIPIVTTNADFIQSIQSVTLSVSTGTAGNFGVTASRALTSISLGLANAGTVANVIDLGMPRIQDNAALYLIILPGSSNSGTLIGSGKLIQG